MGQSSFGAPRPAECPRRLGGDKAPKGRADERPTGSAPTFWASVALLAQGLSPRRAARARQGARGSRQVGGRWRRPRTCRGGPLAPFARTLGPAYEGKPVSDPRPRGVCEVPGADGIRRWRRGSGVLCARDPGESGWVGVKDRGTLDTQDEITTPRARA